MLCCKLATCMLAKSLICYFPTLKWQIFAKILPNGAVIWIEFQSVMFFRTEGGQMSKNGAQIGTPLLDLR